MGDAKGDVTLRKNRIVHVCGILPYILAGTWSISFSCVGTGWVLVNVTFLVPCIMYDT